MAFKYSITLASFRKLEPIEDTLDRLRAQRYDAVEMFGEPEQENLKELGETFASHGIAVSGVTGMWGRQSSDHKNRKLLSRDPQVVSHSENYVKKCIEMCHYLGGGELNVCLFADEGDVFDANHQTKSESQRQSALDRAVPLISSLARFASDHDVDILIEPLNRYSTPYCASARDALYVAGKVNHERVGVLLDTFHMNIEEASIVKAITDSRDFLRHTHFADNNRSMPGNAHIDFESIVDALKKIKYDRYVSFEPNLTDANYTHSTEEGLKFIRGLEGTTL